MAWAVLLNVPGVLLLAAPMLESAFGGLVLLLLPLYALWALPAAVLRGAAPDWFAVGEFGTYPTSALGWFTLFAFWTLVALAIAGLAGRARHR